MQGHASHSNPNHALVAVHGRCVGVLVLWCVRWLVFYVEVVTKEGFYVEWFVLHGEGRISPATPRLTNNDQSSRGKPQEQGQPNGTKPNSNANNPP